MRRFFDVSLPTTAGTIALGAVAWIATNSDVLAYIAACFNGTLT